MLYIHVVLIALCLLFNKNKTIPLFVLLWLLFININDVARPDYDVYEQWYNESVVVSDKGWFLLSRIFSNFGFSYKTFSTLIYALGYVTLYKNNNEFKYCHCAVFNISVLLRSDSNSIFCGWCFDFCWHIVFI